MTFLSHKTVNMGKRKQIIKKEQMVVIQDAITDEMATAKVTMIVSRDTPKYKNEPFTILFQASTWLIGRDTSPSACKVLIALCSCVDYGNKITKTQDELAKHLGYHKRQIERAYKELEESKILHKEKNPVDSRMVDWYVNAYQSWRGTITDRKKRLQKTDPNQLGMFTEDTPKKLNVNKDF